MKFLIDTATGKVYPEEKKEFSVNDVEDACLILDDFTNNCYGYIANKIKFREEDDLANKWENFKKLF